jgi:hypothetical protein
MLRHYLKRKRVREDFSMKDKNWFCFICIEINPFKYHHLCGQNLSLLCFVVNSYLCICDVNHSRAECFGYDHNLDQCSSCLSGGTCLSENRWRSNFVCLCRRCDSGKYCEFSSEYFSFTVDQLFSRNFLSKKSIENQLTIVLLIFVSWFLFLIGLLNNLCCFVTFRCVKCLRNGIGHYLLWMSVTNQINLTFLALRLTHLTLNTTGFRSNSSVDRIFCKILNYLLISSDRIPYWFFSLIAIERVYITIFIRGQWLNKPHIAKRLLMIMLSFVTSRRSCHRSFQILVFLGFQARFFFYPFYTRFLSEKTDLDFLARSM